MAARAAVPAVAEPVARLVALRRAVAVRAAPDQAAVRAAGAFAAAPAGPRAARAVEPKAGRAVLNRVARLAAVPRGRGVKAVRPSVTAPATAPGPAVPRAPRSAAVATPVPRVNAAIAMRPVRTRAVAARPASAAAARALVRVSAVAGRPAGR